MTALVVLVLLPILAGLSVARSGARTAELAGVATVLTVAQTSVVLGDRPVVRMRLRVEAGDMAPYETDASTPVPAAAMSLICPGARLAVKVDPTDPTTVAVDLTRVAVTPAMATA